MGVRVTAVQAAQLVRRSEKWVRGAIRRGELPAEADAIEGGRKLGRTADGRLVGPSRWAIDTDDLIRLPGVRLNAMLLAELKAQADTSPYGMRARLTELERQVQELQRQVRELRRGRPGAYPETPVTLAGEHEAPARYAEAGAGPTGVVGIGSNPPGVKRPDLALSAFGASSPNFGASHPADDLDDLFESTYTPPGRRAVPTMRLNSGLPDDLVGAAAFAAQHGIAETTVKKAMQTGRLPAQQGHWKHGRVYVSWALDADGRRAFYALYGDRPDFTRCAECPH